ncbi:MAG: hypothetical protein AB1423_14350 [Pseudomonadota bacterium]
MKKNTDYVVVDTKDGGGFHCEHCNARYKPKYPIPLNLFVAISKQFVKDHADCVKTDAGETDKVHGEQS